MSQSGRVRRVTSRQAVQLFVLAGCLVLLGSWPSPVVGQATVSSGSIQGSVTDPSGAVVPGAKVTITNVATGLRIERLTTSQGAYTSGAVPSGDYQIRVEAPNFKTSQVTVSVQIGSAASGNVRMEVGSSSQTVEVSAEAVSINTEQPTVQGVLTSAQIENLPVGGRNFLDLAQLEPGVQIQDGGSFDPTKNGFSSISFGGRAGRTARIEVDGIDISDETVGTTTQNVSAGAISEFQLSQSTLDLSTELTSSGAVNVVTKSGSNKFHGEGFYNFRDKNAGIANFPGGQDTYFQRNQFGGNLGGKIINDKLFWFVNAERVKQSTFAPIVVSAPFNAIPPGYSSPFKDTTLLGKLDYNGPRGMKLFYRFNYNWNGDIAAFGSTFQPFANRDNTPSHGIGLDWATGKFTHSVRYGYQKFQNHIADAVLGGGVFDPAGAEPVSIRIGGATSQYRFGPSRLAPQATFQSNNQIKYDGSYLMGAHLIRFGVDFNHILGGGFASFYNWPEIRATSFGTAAQATAASGPFPGGSANPLNYTVSQIVLGNGQGFNTERPAFGYPAGGQYDNRFGFYIGDTWKFRPTLTFTYGVRYSRDTGRADSDLAPITCDQISTDTAAAATAALGAPICTGSQRLLDQVGGWGGRVSQPNANFGPQIGFAWNPGGNGKTVIRGGGGLYYENAIFNNVLFDRPVRLSKGLFNQVNAVCPSGQLPVPGGIATTFPFNGVDTSIASLCSGFIGNELPQVAALEAFYQAATAAGGAQANGGFVGSSLTSGNGADSPSLIAPNYKTPYSWQMNLGFQQQLGRGTVLSIDGIRNVGLHYLLAVDTNHVGDARYFSPVAAQAAINATLAQCGVANVGASIASCPGLFQPDPTLPHYHPGVGTNMEDFASNGLGSGADIGGGTPWYLAGLSNPYAFGGINPAFGTTPLLFPIGRSVYTALQFKLTNQITKPTRWMSRFSSQVSYSLSRFNSMATDQDFVNSAMDFANPGRYFGPNQLDRTSQLSFGTFFDIARGPQLSFVGHFFSPLAITPTLVAGGNLGEVFYTDLQGDGSTFPNGENLAGQVVPGANVGSYGRKYKGSGINSLINSFNANFANTLTPAGTVLVNSGLMTATQLASLGATIAPLPNAPANQANMGWLKTFDLKASYPIRIHENMKLTPSVAAYNLFNFVNFDVTSVAPGLALAGRMDGSPGSISGTPNGAASHPRAGLGSGVNTIGSPRQMEFGLQLVF